MDTKITHTDYTVAIRTLGTSGSKYQTLLDSIKAQTLPPRKILVYIPIGYDLPKETIGIEQYIRVEKGMVAQRAQSLEYIDTEFVMLSDDDMYYPPTFVENLFVEVKKNQADCIIPNIYPQHTMSIEQKVASYFYNSVSWRKDDGWALKIKRDAGYSYNNSPKSCCLPTQTGPGGCMFCRTSAYKSIHFEDERWLEMFSFASFDDQLFCHKLLLQGNKLFLYYNSGLQHLDARAGVRPSIIKKMYFKKKLLFVVWYRTIYNIRGKSKGEKRKCILAFTIRNIIGLAALIGDIIRYRHLNYLVDYFKGLRDGYKYVHSEAYLKYPPFDQYIKQSNP